MILGPPMLPTPPNDHETNHEECIDTFVFSMILGPAMQKTMNLQCLCVAQSQNNSICNDSGPCGAKTTVFAMILGPAMQKRQYLQ